MSHLEIFLLGTVQVRHEENPVSERAYAKVLALLAWLAVESDRSHQRAYLATLLWPDQSDERARHSLRQALSTLRRMIGDDKTSEYLTITRDAIRFNRTSDAMVDATEFRELVETCERHQHSRLDRCPPCMQRLQQAVTLYRGEFLQGFSVGDSIEFEDWVQVTRERLRHHALTAHTTIADYHVERGAIDDAAATLRQLLAIDPLEEAAHRQLILLLVQSGKRAEALAQYERCRQLLDDELGVEPEPEIVALYEQLRSADGPSRSRSPRTAQSPATLRMPAPATALVGREQELEEIVELLAHRDCRLLTLTGPGGSGKTRLAIQVATDQERQFPGAACFVPLASIHDPTEIVPAIAAELGLALFGEVDPERQLLDWLRDRSLFIVLDNAEHFVEDLGVVASMLSAAPDVKLLVTSRERLNLHGEWVFEVGGLSFPMGEDTDSFEGYGAVELLRERLRQVRTRTPLRHEERPAVVRICQLVEGMPLALELAAAWAQSLSLEQIALEIQKNLDFLSTSMRDMPDRHRSIRAVFNQTWSMLCDEDKTAYRRLSVFRNGFFLEAAEVVVGTSAFQLASLTGKSLLVQQSPGRHRLLELLRQYGEERLQQDPDEYHALQARHCEYYLELLAGYEEALTGGDQHAALNAIERDIDNIRSAWRWGVEHNKVYLVSKAAHALWLFYVIRGWMREAAGAFGGVLEALEPGDAPEHEQGCEWKLARAKALTRAGGFQSGLGRYDIAVTHMEAGIALLRELDERREIGLALNMLAAAHHMKGTLDISRKLLEESLECFRQANDAWGVAFSLNDLGLVSYRLAENVDAERFCEESRAMFREIGDRRGHAFAAYNLGMIAADGGHYERARELFEESLSMREESHDRWGIAASMVQLGTVLQKTGSSQEARKVLLRALAIAWESSVSPVVLNALVEMAALDLDAGEPGRAAEVLAAIVDHPATPDQLRSRVDELLQEVELPDFNLMIVEDRNHRAVRVVDEIARELVG